MGFFRSNLLVWVLLSVMFACLVLWGFTGTAQFILAAVLSGLGLLYVVLHCPLETRSEATLSQPAPQQVVKQEHQRDHRHRQHDGQQGEGHGISVTPFLRQLAGSTLIWQPACNPLVTYGIPIKIRYCEHWALPLLLIHPSAWKVNSQKFACNVLSEAATVFSHLPCGQRYIADTRRRT